jgi:glycosyltransferase involved in cell wall biosynthesis
MFTFAIITFNHEKYILEHLESIKYQIMMFGRDNVFKLVVSDDCSTDRTILLVKKWAETSSNLFCEVIISVSSENQGIVKNYLRAVNNIGKDNFKLLAGDDLYYKNDVTKVIEDHDMVLTPVIRFNTGIISDIDDTTMLLMQSFDWHSMKKLQRFQNILCAPGVFIKREIAQDKDLIAFVSQFKWIEDLPKWHYLLNYKKDLRVSLKRRPFVLYRVTSGISNNANHTRHIEFKKEERIISNKMDIKTFKYPKYINPYRYYCKFIKLKLKYFDAKIDEEVRSCTNGFKREMQDSPAYLSLIRQRAHEFRRSIGEELTRNGNINQS